jgi:hypothetical protein
MGPPARLRAPAELLGHVAHGDNFRWPDATRNHHFVTQGLGLRQDQAHRLCRRHRDRCFIVVPCEHRLVVLDAEGDGDQRVRPLAFELAQPLMRDREAGRDGERPYQAVSTVEGAHARRLDAVAADALGERLWREMDEARHR